MRIPATDVVRHELRWAIFELDANGWVYLAQLNSHASTSKVRQQQNSANASISSVITDSPELPSVRHCPQ